MNQKNGGVILLREAKRLRFSDPALEQRYRDEALMDGLMRARIMAVLALSYMSVIGFIIASRVQPVGVTPELTHWELTIRFLVVAPAWVLLFISTYLPGHRRWGTWLYAAVTAWAAGSLVLRSWWPVLALNLPTGGVGGAINSDFVSVMVISTIALPMRRTQVILTVVAGALLPLAWLRWHAEPKYFPLLQANAETLIGTGLVVIALAWLRERTDRMIFAQRVSLNRANAELENSRAELAQANADLSRVNAEQTTFMGIAAHDLRAPLATVRGYAELLQKSRLPEGEARQNALREIETQSARMLSLVSDYLGAHAAAGRAEPAKLARLDVTASARAAVARHAPAAATKTQTLTLAEAATTWAQADETRLAQVMDNFVVNALKFSPNGATVRLAVESRGTTVRLAVSDEGPGIAVEERAGLFRMFGRGSAKPTGGEASHGFGLAVAKRLAESMGGAVGCDSAPERGATFWVELPATA